MIFLSIPDPGVKKASGPGFRSATLDKTFAVCSWQEANAEMAPFLPLEYRSPQKRTSKQKLTVVSGKKKQRSVAISVQKYYLYICGFFWEVNNQDTVQCGGSFSDDKCFQVLNFLSRIRFEILAFSNLNKNRFFQWRHLL